MTIWESDELETRMNAVVWHRGEGEKRGLKPGQRRDGSIKRARLERLAQQMRAEARVQGRREAVR